MVSLGDLLMAWVPSHPVCQTTDSGARQRDGGAAGPADSQSQRRRSWVGVKNTAVVIDGVTPPFETPLGVLYDELKYYDMYLYVIPIA